MVIRFKELEKKRMEKPRGGLGFVDADVYKDILNIEGKITAFNHMTLGNGSSIGYHQHIGDMEIYLILEGKAKYNNNGEEVFVEKGDLTFCNKDEFHSIEAIDEKGVQFLAVIIG